MKATEAPPVAVWHLSLKSLPNKNDLNVCVTSLECHNFAYSDVSAGELFHILRNRHAKNAAESAATTSGQITTEFFHLWTERRAYSDLLWRKAAR